MSTHVVILEARGLTKRYAGIPVVDHVSFQIDRQEILGCLGPNGAGKSTTVKMLVGLLDASEGQVLFHGQDIRRDLLAFKRRLGYVPEQPDLYSFLSGWEYLELVATLRGLPRKRSHDKMSSLLESLTLTHARHAPIASYSKGMRQRIVLIAALLHDPEVLILDEPFSGLDVTSVLVVRRVIEILAGQGKAIFFSSPVLEVMEKICSKIVILKKGIVVASGATQDISNSFSRGDLESVFLHLTDEVDADRVAGNIVAAVNDASG